MGDPMYNNLKLTKKAGKFFLLFMLLCTFLSRSVFYFLTPKVLTQSIKGGVIENEIKIDNIDLIYKDIVTNRIILPDNYKLYVEKIFIYEGALVKKGDTILKFSPIECEILKRDLQNDMMEINSKMHHLQEVKKNINEEYEEKLKNISIEQELLISNIETDTILQDLQIKNKSLDYEQMSKAIEASEELFKIGAISENALQKQKLELEKMGNEINTLNEIYNKSLDKIEKEYESKVLRFDAQKRELRIQQKQELLTLENEQVLLSKMNTLKTVYNNLLPLLSEGQVVAQEDGMLYKMNVKEASYYDGKEFLFQLIPKESEISYRVSLTKEQEKYLDRVKEACLKFGNNEVAVKMLGTYKEDEKTYLIFETEAILTKDQQANLVLLLKEELTYYDTIIPSSALIDEHVFVLSSQEQGIWGTAYYIQEIKVEVGRIGSKEVGIISGLLEGQEIVTYWDRTIKNKQRVMLMLP